MNSYKTLGITALVALIVGFCLGFIPEHTKSSHQQDEIASLTQGKGAVENQLGQARNQLTLSVLTIQSAVVSADAEENNYSVASSGASAFFTDLRKFTDQTQDQQIKQQFSEILGTRDRTIAGLAKADPAVKPLLQEIFRKTQAVEEHAMQGN